MNQIHNALNYALQEAQNRHSMVSQTRSHDRTTPYWVHPTLGAMMIMEDNNGEALAPPEERLILAVAFLFHDLVEDTDTAEEDLREWFQNYPDLYDSERIIGLVNGCTFLNGGSREECAYLKENVDNIAPEVWYLKTVDKWINLITPSYFIQKGKLEFYKGFLGFLESQASQTRYSESELLRNVRAYLVT